ncbi:endo-1,3;1,4-beta-D-glucanase-like isoform X3 [Camellia sinensis]|uniref:endo-1,3;1,4-beta-D-glucanase-like isoform X3 n=1 Tax=Camellia sinensis TaxID=4442 RepID=UPI0010366DB0|nr:endo-1,3;1,4-beta-D-glucanase-like isoform X3 [Camellia sinensis]
MSGSQCCENPPAALSASCGGSGSLVELAGLKVYATGSPDSNFAILLISDVFDFGNHPHPRSHNNYYLVLEGYEAPNLRKLADKVAAAGFYVVVPDFFYGDPYKPENTEKPLPVWIQSHGTDKGFEDAKPVIAALKNKGISAIGAAGFCWGAKVVVELSKSDYLQAAVLLHPSLVTVDDIKELKVPIAILGAEIDKISPPELLKQFEEVLSSKRESGTKSMMKRLSNLQKKPIKIC